MSTLQQLEARLQSLEDIEAIRRLKYHYCYACDEGDFDRLAACFAKDCRVDLGQGRVAEGREQVVAMFRKIAPLREFSSHMVHNPLIQVSGDAATGTWYLHLPSTRSGIAMWSQARYDEEYVREDGEWRIRSERVTMYFATPFDKGWVKERFMTGLTDKYAALLVPEGDGPRQRREGRAQAP